MLGVLFLALTLAGCVSTRVVYVPEAEKATFVRAGQAVTATVDSWLVPSGTFALLLEQAERNQAEKANR